MNEKSNICFTVFEYDDFKVEKIDNPKIKTISDETFNEILKLSMATVSGNKDSIANLIDVRYQNGRPLIKFKNYVGCINLPNGICFEILPKVARPTADVAYARKIVLKMLEIGLQINPSVRSGIIGIEKKMPIFEIFIRSFLLEVDVLFKKGLKRLYNSFEENVAVMKGRILFTKNITENYVHKERLYVEYDIYDINRAENKLIKSTLILLKKISKEPSNIKNINRLLLNMDSIAPSTNIDGDLAKSLLDRSASDYEEAIKYARVFLKGYGFSIYSGQMKSNSLLFPMELLYQDYVFYSIKSYLKPRGYKVKGQDGSFYLFTEPKKFNLRPDIVIVKNGSTFILDTKWKNITKETDISQSDMYQAYCYHTRYPNVKRTVLLYPKYSNSQAFSYKSPNNVSIEAKFISLLIEDHRKDFENIVNSCIS